MLCQKARIRACMASRSLSHSILSDQNRLPSPSLSLWRMFQDGRTRWDRSIGGATTGCLWWPHRWTYGRFTWLRFDPFAMHSSTSLRAHSSSQIIVLSPDPTNHPRTTRVPLPKGSTIEETDCTLKIRLRGKVDEGARRPGYEKDRRGSAPRLSLDTRIQRWNCSIEVPPKLLMRSVIGPVISPRSEQSRLTRFPPT